MLPVLGQGIIPPLQITEREEYFDEHKYSLIPVWLPTASPEFMVLEERMLEHQRMTFWY
jgi:hypothetical protein